MSSATRLGRLLLVLGVVGVPSLARGQGNIFNPYGNSGYSDYREFGSPKYGNDPTLPNQSRITGSAGSRYNTLDDFNNSLEGGIEGGLGGSRPSSVGVPFYRAYQIESQQARRAVRSAETAKDQDYRTLLAQRNEIYLRALQTSDPKERTRLLREVDALTKRTSVDRARTTPPTTAPGVARTGTAPATRPASPTNPSAATPVRPTTPATTTPRSSSPATAAPVTPEASPAATQPAPTAPTTNPASVPVPAPG